MSGMGKDGFRLPSLPYIRLDVEFIALEDLHLPRFMGSTLRGAFGYAFRKAVCVARNMDCPSCPIYDRCVYAYVFDTPTVGKNGLLQKTPFAPHPFVLTPPPIGRNEFRRGETLRFGLTLFGRAVNYLPHFLMALEVLGRSGLGRNRGRLALTRTTQDGTIISDGTELMGEPRPHYIAELDGNAHGDIHGVKIDFLTPTKLIWRGRILYEPHFPAIVEAISRRLRWLVQFHTDGKWDYPAEQLRTPAEKVELKSHDVRDFDLFRYSTRKRRRMQFKGFIGEAVFEGETDIFLPLLKAGEVIHIGKATSFGFGRVAVEPLS